jgi:hypothetical protein
MTAGVAALPAEQERGVEDDRRGLRCRIAGPSESLVARVALTAHEHLGHVGTSTGHALRGRKLASDDGFEFVADDSVRRPPLLVIDQPSDEAKCDAYPGTCSKPVVVIANGRPNDQGV